MYTSKSGLFPGLFFILLSILGKENLKKTMLHAGIYYVCMLLPTKNTESAAEEVDK